MRQSIPFVNLHLPRFALAERTRLQKTRQQQHSPGDAKPAMAGEQDVEGDETITKLKTEFDVNELTVISSSKIRGRVELLRKLLQDHDESGAAAKPALVAISAKAPVVNKLLSIVEILKRDLVETRASSEGKQQPLLFQYMRLGHVEQHKAQPTRPPRQLTDVAPTEQSDRSQHETSNNPNDGKADKDNDDEEEGQYFETQLPKPSVRGLGQPQQQNTSISTKHVPLVTIFLSRQQVPTLKAKFGEQILHNPR